MHYALIRFLNARPLWWGLTSRPEAGETFEFTSPARCADLIAGGKAGLGLIPAVELARIPDVVALPSICIASATEVRSVLMVSKVPFETISSVALDPNSRTSVTLARILLAERLGERRYRSIRFDAVDTARLPLLEGHDAAVIIGDPALQLSRGDGAKLPHVYDLVSEWNALFGEPFVFAVWAGRRQQFDGLDCEAVLDRMLRSREYGLSQIERIAQEASEELALPLSELLEYFGKALHYSVGEREQAALSRFLRLASKYGLVEGERTVEWLNCGTR